MMEKKQQHKKKRGKVQHIRGSPKKRKISGKAVFSSESIPGKMLADVKNLITDKASELKRADQKKLFLANFPYLMFESYRFVVWNRRRRGCKAYYYLPHEKCQEISAGCGVWFCQMGNRKRYTTIC